jgi:hypothetical protein
MISSTLKKRLSILLLFSWLIFVFYDFFYSLEFNIEGKYFFILVPAIVVSVIQLFVEFKPWLTHLLFYLIFGIILIQFYSLLIAAWGYLFLGTHFPISWFIAMILNCLLAINRLEIYYRFNKKKQ